MDEPLQFTDWKFRWMNLFLKLRTARYDRRQLQWIIVRRRDIGPPVFDLRQKNPFYL